MVTQNGLLPPNATDFEEIILGAIMLEKDAINEVIEILTPDSFYNDNYSRIYASILSIHSRNEPINIMTVTLELKKTNQLEIVGGAYAVTCLTNRIASSENIEFNARIVAQKFIQRELIRISSQSLNEAYAPDTDVFELLDKIKSNLFKIENGLSTNKSETTKSIVDRTIKAIEEAKNNKGILGPSIGLKALDDVLMGIRTGTVYVIAGKSGMGKSALMNCIAKSIAITHNLRIGIFSLEMPAVQLVRRLLSDLAGIDNRTLASGLLSSSQILSLRSVQNIIDERFVIDDTPAITIQYLENRIRKLSADGVKYFLIDYVQLMTLTSADAKGKLEESQIAYITSNIKRLAKKYDCAIFPLAQLNRTSDKRTNNKPVLSDLKGSSSIEQNADVVIMIHRPEYYNEFEINGRSTKGLAELIIAKHRDGPTESVIVKYVGYLTRFEDLEESNNSIEEQTVVVF